MKRRFDINKLPKQYRDMIEEIEWNDGQFDDEVSGMCYLKDGYLIDGESHIFTFLNRSSLLNDLKYSIERE